MGKRPRTEIQTAVVHSPLDQAVALALATISRSERTRRSYRSDFDRWVAFCREHDADPIAPPRGAVVSWMETMRQSGEAPLSRARRISALSSIFRELCRQDADEEHKRFTRNPFSADLGPKRDKTPAALKPTPLAEVDVIRAAIASCDSSPLGVRDAAIIRILWSTGMRRVSLLSMTIERLQRDRDGVVATVVKKGGDTQRVLIRGHAREAFELWREVLRDGAITTGAVWRKRNGSTLSERGLGHMLTTRSKGTGGKLSPHMFRVAFLTHNEAGLEAKQHAAGHADPKTTQGYDRTSWRGREAFEQMPEIEDIE